MIFRRLALAFKQQDWFTVLVELVLVIAGVLIALQLNNWNEYRSQRLEETQYLEQLLVEFAVIRDTIEEHEEAYRNYRDTALELVAVSQGDREVPPERLSQLYQTALAGNIPSGAPAALRELISSGKMGLVRNRELRTLLMRVDFTAKFVDRVFELLRSALLEQSQDVRVHVSYDTQRFGAMLPDKAVDGTRAASYTVNLQGLRQDPRAVSAVKSYLEAQQNMLEVTTIYLGRVETVIGAIETELKR